MLQFAPLASNSKPALGFAAAETSANYIILTRGKPCGQAKLSQGLLPGGGKLVVLIMTLRSGDDRVVVKTQTTYGQNGAMSHAEQRIFPFGKPAVKEVTVDFDNAGARVTTKVGTAVSQSVVPCQQTWRLANPSTFWFLKTTPPPGQVEQSYEFNLDTLHWELCVMTYEGKTHKGYLVRLEREGRTVETAFGSDGLPQTIKDESGLELDRS